jgi:peptidoglycan hydrolase-like protein with peptidoglycan-binding domain
MGAMGYAAGLGVSPPSSGIGEAKAPTDVSNFTDTKFGDTTNFTPAPAAPPPGEGVEAAHQATAAAETATSAAPDVASARALVSDRAGGADISHLEDAFVTRLAAGITASEAATGQRLTLNSGFRSPEEQGRLYAEKKALDPNYPVAPAGGSVHNFGYAADFNRGPAYDYLRENADKWGLMNIGTAKNPNYDYPHIQIAGPRNVSGGAGSRFDPWSGAVDPFANATTYGAGGPPRGGGFERDPNGNPVPPADIPGGMTIPPGTPHSAGMDNKNPGNLQWSGSDWQKATFPGALGPSKNLDAGKAQIVFDTQENGMTAAATLAIHRATDNGLNTVEKLIGDPKFGLTAGSKLAPGAIVNISKAMGVKPGDVIDMNDPATAKSFMRAYVNQEHGAGAVAYTDDFINAGVDRALGRTSGAAGAAEAQATGGPMPAAPGGADFSIPGAGFGQPEAYAAAPAPAAAKPTAPAAPAGAAPAAAGKQPSLKIGSSGPAVRDLQTQLLAAGYNPGPIDGKFGPQTRAALYKFQQATPGTGSRFGQPDTIAGPRTQAALPGANPYRDTQPPEDIVVRPPGGYVYGRDFVSNVPGGTIFPPEGYAAGLTPAAFDERFGPTPAPGITPAAFNERFGPTMTPAAAAPPPSAGPNFDETFNAPTPPPGQELTPEQGAGTMATRADLRDRLPGAAATTGAGYYRGLQSVEEDRASRARLPETIASTYAAITGGGGTDQFAGGPTGGISPPAPDFSTNPAAVGANIGAASAAAPPTSSGYVPTPYRDPGMEPDRLDRLRQDFDRIKGGADTAALGGGIGSDVLAEPSISPPPYAEDFSTPEEEQRRKDQFGAYPAKYNDPNYQRGPMHTPRERAPVGYNYNRRTADSGAAALTAPEPDVVRTLASLPPEGQAQYRSGFVNNIIDSIDQAGDARGILRAIDASPQASRRLEVVLGAPGASQFKSLVRVDGIGNREPGTRFAAALPSMAGLRGSPPVDSQVAARVGAMLDSEDPAEFSRGLKIVAANPSLQALVQRVDAMV